MTATDPTRWARAAWLRAIARWLLVVAGVAAAFWLSLYVALFGLFFGPFPKDLVEPTASFLTAFLVVATGGLLAPHHRPIVSLVLMGPGVVLATWLTSLPDVPAVAGALSGAALVAWAVWPVRPRRATVAGAILGGGVVLAFSALVVARYVDWPARSDDLPIEAREALGAEVAQVTDFFVYELGGFIDREFLWRCDAPASAVARLAAGLGLERVDAAPPEFWRMPPHYWPPVLPTGAELFQSRGFSATDRGPDGSHYFLVHDPARGRAYVWVKANF